MPDLPTTSKGAATSRRILDAAAEEFAERGIAGARVDRIISAAQTNKAQLYGYFGSKDGLFDAVVADSADRVLAAVSLESGEALSRRLEKELSDFSGRAIGVLDQRDLANEPAPSDRNSRF